MTRTIKLAAASAKADASAVLLFSGTTSLPSELAAFDKQHGGVVAAALSRKETSLERGSVTTLYPADGTSRVYVVGLGDAKKLQLQTIRIAAAKVLKSATTAQIKTLAFNTTIIGNTLASDDIGEAIGEGLALGSFNFDSFKGAVTNNDPKAKPKPGPLNVVVDKAARDGFSRGLILGEGANIARELAATPPNVANPKYLVDYCRKMAKKVGLKCTIIDAARAKQLKMGGLTAVGQAGSTPPAMIVLEWAGKGKATAAPLLFVGKAITFDTGGYSIKPAASMTGMKYDKCGGMAVLGAMFAIAAQKLPVRAVGIIPAAENMVSERAYRPDDIITFCNGVTAEITNTDAEGRLVLADGLAYGTKTYKPAAVVDLATLTGGVVVALGDQCAGAFVNDPTFHKQMFDAGEHAGEKLWHLPLWDEHRDAMKGIHSDIVNSGGRKAHPIQGAAFLSFFVGADAPTKMPELPWCHLDIAGVADMEADTPLFPKGPTGFGVRLLARLAAKWK